MSGTGSLLAPRRGREAKVLSVERCQLKPTSTAPHGLRLGRRAKWKVAG